MPSPRDKMYIQAYHDYPFRFSGRAAGRLAQLIMEDGSGRTEKERLDEALRRPCLSGFLGAKGVHIDPYGNVFSGTCSGIVLGNLHRTPLEDLWQSFRPGQDGLIGTLCKQGPFGLLERAKVLGYETLPAYTDKCHLCTHIRQFLFERRAEPSVIGPADCYGL